MFKLGVFCLFFFSAWTKDFCHPNQKVIKGEGITIQKQEEFTKSFNDYRNQVARGAIQNWDQKGLTKTASLMNYIEWDNELAALAEECVNVCPQHIQTDCKIPALKGRVFRILYSSSDYGVKQQQLNTDAFVDGCSKDEYAAKQIQQGDITRFGCGTISFEQPTANPVRSILVCVFDKVVTLFQRKGVIYEEGPIGSKCPNGLMSGRYQALCKK